MTELLDRAYAEIMSSIVKTAQAPHFTELAASMEVPIEQGRELMHELVGMTPGWMHPGTDFLASFPPFNLQPTQYRISVDDKHGWFGQWGFESLAVRWLFPGSTIRIEAPCLCCSEPMVIELRDEQILATEPAEMVGYSSESVGGDAATRPFRWAAMNLFRSEEHARTWPGFNPEFSAMLKPVAKWADIFANPFFRERGRSDYISWTRSEAGAAAFADLRAQLAP